MFKKRPIYIVGIVVFTLILIADLVLYFFSPVGAGWGDMGGFGGGKPDGGYVSREDIGAGNEGKQDFGGFGGENMQKPNDMEKTDGMTLPEGMEAPEGQEPPEGMEMPEG